MDTQSNILVKLDNISVMLNNKQILNDINLEIHRNAVTTLVGPNGAGKSTLLKVILKLMKPDNGHISYAKNLSIGYVPQKISLDHNLPLTVLQFLKLKKTVKIQQIHTISELLSIDHLLQNSMHKLSGGELQRVLLARALLNKPQLLVLDEPVQGVDMNGQIELYQLINESKKRFNCAVLMVSHDLHLVMANTDQVICINQHVCCMGTPESVSSDPDFIHHFGSDLAENFAVYTHHHDHHHTLHGEVCHCAEEQHHNLNNH